MQQLLFTFCLLAKKHCFVNLYINQLIINKSDITTPLRRKNIIWYNGMFISKRAFQLNNIIVSKNRYIYEYIFKNNRTRIKGILSDKCIKTITYLKIFDDKNIEYYYKKIFLNDTFKLIIHIFYKNILLYFLLILLIKSNYRFYKFKNKK